MVARRGRVHSQAFSSLALGVGVRGAFTSRGNLGVINSMCARGFDIIMEKPDCIMSSLHPRSLSICVSTTAISTPKRCGLSIITAHSTAGCRVLDMCPSAMGIRFSCFSAGRFTMGTRTRNMSTIRNLIISASVMDNVRKSVLGIAKPHDGLGRVRSTITIYGIGHILSRARDFSTRVGLLSKGNGGVSLRGVALGTRSIGMGIPVSGGGGISIITSFAGLPSKFGGSDVGCALSRNGISVVNAPRAISGVAGVALSTVSVAGISLGDGAFSMAPGLPRNMHLLSGFRAFGIAISAASCIRGAFAIGDIGAIKLGRNLAIGGVAVEGIGVYNPETIIGGVATSVVVTGVSLANGNRNRRAISTLVGFGACSGI